MKPAIWIEIGVEHSGNAAHQRSATLGHGDCMAFDNNQTIGSHGIKPDALRGKVRHDAMAMCLIRKINP